MRYEWSWPAAQFGLQSLTVDLPIATAAALLASAEGYTPRANHALDAAREELGTVAEVANALADDLPAPKAHPGRRRRRRRKRKPAAGSADGAKTNATPGVTTEPAAKTE